MRLQQVHELSDRIERGRTYWVDTLSAVLFVGFVIALVEMANVTVLVAIMLVTALSGLPAVLLMFARASYLCVYGTLFAVDPARANELDQWLHGDLDA